MTPRNALLAAALITCGVWNANGFHIQQNVALSKIRVPSLSSSAPLATTALSMSSEDGEFSREVRLREEAESPFRKVRYFFYFNGAGGAFASLAVSLARIAAALSGVNTDLMQESLTNAAVDIAGLVVIGFLYKRDIDAEQSRLKRASKGAELAKLSVRASKKLLGEDDDTSTFTTNLASLRRGRGIEKRVILAAAGPEKLAQILQDANDLAEPMDENDLVLVPILYPQGVAPQIGEGTATPTVPPCVALPVSVSQSWKNFIDDEAAEALKQNVDIEKEGFSVILKKNGRVGQRTRGVFLNNMVGNVIQRRDAGMDVANI